MCSRRQTGTSRGRRRRLSYKMGQLKILELRARAQQQLGGQFDIREFHDQVVDSGALPLDVLEEQINAWIAQKEDDGKGAVRELTADTEARRRAQ